MTTDDQKTTTTTIDITPNYSGIFAIMMRDAQGFAESMKRVRTSVFGDVTKPPHSEKDLHAFISRINVAIHAMGTTEELEQLRVVIDLAAKNLNIRQTLLDGDEPTEA